MQNVEKVPGSSALSRRSSTQRSVRGVKLYTKLGPDHLGGPLGKASLKHTFRTETDLYVLYAM